MFSLFSSDGSAKTEDPEYDIGYGATDAEIGRQIRSMGYEFPIVYDVGGSNGSWVNVMSKVWPDSRFELFEPLAEIEQSYIDVLVYLKEIHSESYMHPIAVGERDGSISVNLFDDASGATTLPLNRADDSQSVTVPVRSIDSIVSSGMCDRPDVIKMDIQGGELAALKGAEETLPGVQFLMLETWTQRSYGKHTPLLGELIEFLAPLGFAIYDLGDKFREESGQTVSVDVWFINTAIANDSFTI